MNDGFLTTQGFRIRYADGSIVSGRTDAEWFAAPTRGVVVVSWYADQEYPCWHQDGYDEQGFPRFGGRREQQERIYNYVDIFSGADDYWGVPSLNLRGFGLGSEIPAGLPAGATKQGRTVTDAEFRAMRNAAEDDRRYDGATVVRETRSR